MHLLLEFAPLVTLVALGRVIRMTIVMWLVLIVAVLRVLNGVRTGRVRFLDAGNAVLFVSVSLILELWQPGWTLLTVRTIVSAGVLAVLVASQAFPRPFMLPHARRRPRSREDSAGFMAASATVTWVWAAAFAFSLVVELSPHWRPLAPADTLISLAKLAQFAALAFSVVYPLLLRRRAALAA
jgi:hypothetical protein